MSSDGRQIFVADRGAWAGGGMTGQIFVVPAAGGTARLLPGAEGLAARGIEVSGGDIYFTGSNPQDGAPGVYRIPAMGGAVAGVFEGAPLVEPEGIAVGRDGDVFVADHGESAAAGSVYRIRDGAVYQTRGYDARRFRRRHRAIA